ncbi:MAG: hypothetical protein RLZ98_364 [Pseudomonadota bacterium]|jgi:hypothetical protein
MLGNAKYIAVLLAFIGSAIGYVYAGSEVQTVHVSGKHTADGSDRKGRTTTRLVIETDKGNLPILKFPVIGYTFGADEIYDSISPGQSLQVRVGQWPPQFMSSHAKPHILAVY